MAQGDLYFANCSNKKTVEQVLRDCVYRDVNGNAVLHTDENGTALEKYFDCDNKHLSIEQILKAVILEDINGEPYINTTS